MNLHSKLRPVHVATCIDWTNLSMGLVLSGCRIPSYKINIGSLQLQHGSCAIWTLNP